MDNVPQKQHWIAKHWIAKHWQLLVAGFSALGILERLVGYLSGATKEDAIRAVENVKSAWPILHNCLTAVSVVGLFVGLLGWAKSRADREKEKKPQRKAAPIGLPPIAVDSWFSIAGKTALSDGAAPVPSDARFGLTHVTISRDHYGTGTYYGYPVRWPSGATGARARAEVIDHALHGSPKEACVLLELSHDEGKAFHPFKRADWRAGTENGDSHPIIADLPLARLGPTHARARLEITHPLEVVVYIDFRLPDEPPQTNPPSTKAEA